MKALSSLTVALVGSQTAMTDTDSFSWYQGRTFESQLQREPPLALERVVVSWYRRGVAEKKEVDEIEACVDLCFWNFMRGCIMIIVLTLSGKITSAQDPCGEICRFFCNWHLNSVKNYILVPICNWKCIYYVLYIL